MLTPTLKDLTQDVVRVRPDGSFVCTWKSHPTFGDMPYHVPNEGEFTELYAELTNWAKSNATMPEESYESSKKAESENEFYKNVESAKLSLIQKLDAHTTKKIYSGFDYAVNGEVLHFNYDQFDQQNFADTANGVLLQKSAGISIADSVVWNGYKNGELKQVELGADDFIALYTQGALAHKQACMAEAGALKVKLREASTGTELKSVASELPFEVVI